MASTIGETFGEAMLSSFVQLYAALRHGPMQWPSLLACSAARPNASCAGVGQLASPLQAALISFSQLHNVFSCQAPAKLSSLTPGSQVSFLSYATWLMPSWLKVPPNPPRDHSLWCNGPFGVEEYMVCRRDCCSVSSLNHVPIKAPTVFPRLESDFVILRLQLYTSELIRRPR